MQSGNQILPGRCGVSDAVALKDDTEIVPVTGGVINDVVEWPLLLVPPAKLREEEYRSVLSFINFPSCLAMFAYLSMLPSSARSLFQLEATTAVAPGSTVRNDAVVRITTIDSRRCTLCSSTQLKEHALSDGLAQVLCMAVFVAPLRHLTVMSLHTCSWSRFTPRSYLL